MVLMQVKRYRDRICSRSQSIRSNNVGPNHSVSLSLATNLEMKCVLFSEYCEQLQKIKLKS